MKDGDAALTIEVAFLISLVAVAFGVYSGACNLKRAAKSEDKKEASDMTTVIVKLENIGDGISEIKNEMRNVKEDVKECRERLIKAEESTKQAHKRIDDFERS